MKRPFILLMLFIFLASCSTVPVGDTSRNALDWPGTYKGDGMTIILKDNNTYRAQINDIEIRSTFRWDNKGQTVCLQHFKAYAPCKKFKVGENVLIPLKNSGKPLKDADILTKVIH
jgi:hypothetical protein